MDSTEIGLLCILLIGCVLLSAFFTQIETALIESRKSRMEHFAESGNTHAQKLLRFLDEPETLIAASQVGITFTSILLGAIAGVKIAPVLSRAFPSFPHPELISLTASIVIFTYISLLFCEFLPKKISVQDPEAVLLRHTRALSVMEIIARPFVGFLSSSANAVMLLLGVNPHIDDAVTEDEVKDLIEQGTEDGIFEKTEQDMVDRIFHMSDQTAYSLMTPRLQMNWLDVNDPTEYNLRRIKKSADTVFTIGDGNLDNFLGVIYAKDLLNAAIDKKKIKLSSFIKKPLFIPRAMETFRVLEKFRESSVHEAVVLDEYGGVIGFITLGDIAEEIIGDIERQDEPENPQITPRSENSWYIDGLCGIDDFKEKFDLDELPNEIKDHYQTMGGFLTSYFGYIPKVGEKCTWNDFTFEILRLDRARIAKLMVIQGIASAPTSPRKDN
ncbi:MAG: HlyC/CorC family transporter [Schwartzia sp.]|nr:HlyC/CorC family transporter [Schwartzia sp. (in: firmicutes)]